MKRILSIGAAFIGIVGTIYADNLVILHTNDTHSQIDPTDKDLGGVLRRKALVDSVRAHNNNVLLIDAGDAVQGTMYFNLFGGKAEAEAMNILGYDMAILGNHEFDNGMEALARNVASVNTHWLATNYDLWDSALAGFFRPYEIRDVAGRRIGFIALNLDPKGMVAEGNYDGVVYNDIIATANTMAAYLRDKQAVDMVVAITHIGYGDMTGTDDVELAAASQGIDIIIGGHSHTVVNPGEMSMVLNAVGRPVLVAQTGKSGLNVGEIKIDLDNLTSDYRLINVDSRFDDRVDAEDAVRLEPYRHAVDSVMSIEVAQSARELEQHSQALQNYLSDFIYDRGRELSGHVDLALLNKGSIRRGLPDGTVTRGMIIMMQPFTNHIVTMRIKGADLRDAFDVMATRDGDGVSRGVRATYNPRNNKSVDIYINGELLDDEREYVVATIDYLANGGDYMEPLTRGVQLDRSETIVYEDLLRYLADKPQGYLIDGDDDKRMIGVYVSDLPAAHKQQLH